VGVFVRQGVFEDVVQVGDVWRQDNLSSPFIYAIEKTDAVREQQRANIRGSTPPVFFAESSEGALGRARRDSLLSRLDRALAVRARYQADLARGRSDEAEADSTLFERLREQTELQLSNRQWQILSESYNERVPGLSTTSRTPLDIRLMLEVWPIAQQLTRSGVIDVPKDTVRAPQLAVRDAETHLVSFRSADSVFDITEANRSARESLTINYPGLPDTVAIAMGFFGQLVVPSLIYDAGGTHNQWRARELEISPNAGRVQSNEVIVRRGELITEEIQQKLISLEHALQDRKGTRMAWQVVVGQIMLTLSIYVWFFLYLFILRPAIFEDNRMVLLISILFAMVVLMYGAALRIPGLEMYMVPVAITAVLLTVIFDSRVAIFALITLSILGSVLLNMDLVYGLSTLFAGTLGVFSVRDIRNRSQFFLSAGVVFLGYSTILLSAFLLESTSLGRFLDQLLFVAVNGVLVLLAYGFLWVFERAFGLTTDVTLLELSDTNRPLLKELSLKAPGTFNHTLQVANLAEAGAAAIGANPLLTRVGALYHDVGKMDKPEYFVENQRTGINPHDQLKPRMSALIIASHVKEGLAIGEEYRLPTEVTKFIPMHHGTTRIEYFYRRALDSAGDDKSDILESDFRYSGPRPDSKETAVLMLADSVEAASRALENPTHKRLKTLIDGLVDSRAADHQLDGTDITFRDLTEIKDIFLKLLVGVFHVRVKYPGDGERAPGAEGAGPK
jgi:cyclic-di-AMP phosphodiesterase PgpH